MAHYTISALVFVAVLSTYLLIKSIYTRIVAHQFSKSHGCEPPARIPQKEHIIGYDFFKNQIAHAKAKNLLPYTLSLFRKHGNTLSAVALGGEFILTSDPENVKTVLSTKFNDFTLGKRINSMGPLLGHGIFTSDGTGWEHSRALVRPSFTKNAIADLETFETHIQNLIAQIPRDGSTFDLQTLFFQLTLDSSTDFLFGESVNSLTSPPDSKQQQFGIKFDFSQNVLLDRVRLGPFCFAHRNKEFAKACGFVHEFVDEIVARGIRAKHEKKDLEAKGKYVFLDELVQATDDPIQIRSELLNILLAGRDTTAGLLSNTFHVLARRPDVWAKLRTEVDDLGGEKPDYETLRGMKYLKWVMNESLRLYPSVPSNGRFAIRNTVLPTGGGPSGTSPVFVRAGQVVSYSPFSMHRRKDFYGPDADEYRPERWESLRVGWEYLPFNGGPRICLGQQFALTSAGYAIVRLLQAFERVENRDERSWVEGLHLTLSAGNGVLVGMIPRA